MKYTSEDIYKKSLITLEFNKIKGKLSAHCLSDEAKSMAESLFPFDRTDAVREALGETDEAKIMIQRRGTPPIAAAHDITASLKRAEVGSALSMGELLKIASLLTTARKLSGYFDSFEDERLLSKHFSQLSPVSSVERRINEAVISPEEMADTASPALYDIRRRTARLHAKVRDLLQDIIHSQRYQKVLQEPIITVRNDRFVVPVKAEYRSELHGLVHDMSASGATLFVEPSSVVDANNRIKMLYAEEKEEMERILYELSAEVAERRHEIENNYYHIVRLDFIFAKAKLALDMKAVTPDISRDAKIVLKRARHPLIDAKTVVPIDIELGEHFDTLVITGPNTGGKTVALKTLGLLCAMALSGLSIPAAEGSAVGVYEYIFSDIGDEQSIEQSLSTFSAHMKNIVAILDACAPRTMVLFDEIGAGTDPVEGAALAIEILERTRRLGAHIAATTHYSELKIYALSAEGVQNASCEFDVETLRPTYKLLIGIPGRSNAFAISERLGLSKSLIENAKKRIGQESLKFEDVIRDLEKNRMEMEQKRDMAQELLKETEAIKRSAELSQKNLQRDKNRILSEARDEAARILNRARETSDSVMGELEALKKKNARELADIKLMENRAALRGKLRAAEKDIDAKEENKEKKGGIDVPLNPGDMVRIIKLDREAVVVEPPEGGKVVLQAGIMRVTVGLDELELVDARGRRAAKKKASPGVRKNINVATRKVNTEIDIRGMTVEEAMYDVDKLIDDAVLLGIKKVQIIHGKGTGALRSGVHTHLRTLGTVASFRLGRYGEGEDGVTIVELK
ncbi:MAG: endonuclease MutS2 [Clostridia bacterium]|nr:endonuclease MutS2 [Clostridia bacterium]